MRSILSVVTIAVCPASFLAADDSGLSAPSVTVGRNLQVDANVRVSGEVPAGGLPLTLTSDDPARLLLSTAPGKPGSRAIELTVPPRFPEGPVFWLQALADEGTATYTVSAPGMAAVKGTVTLTRSAILIAGPMNSSAFPITPRGEPAKIAIYSAAIDTAGKLIAEQPVAAGLRTEVRISLSSPKAGKLREPLLVLAPGSSSAETRFEPAGEGKITDGAHCKSPRNWLSALIGGSMRNLWPNPPFRNRND